LKEITEDITLIGQLVVIDNRQVSKFRNYFFYKKYPICDVINNKSQITCPASYEKK
jgi:hypothetical protein